MKYVDFLAPKLDFTKKKRLQVVHGTNWKKTLEISSQKYKLDF